ncbi:MAG: CNP1-like family protein [Pseudomonadota bacterium]
MKSAQFFFPSASRVLSVALLCCVPACTLANDDEELGWQQNYVEKPGKKDAWQELDVALPAYPERKNLMDLKIATDGMQYTVYLDKPSLVMGEDGVVRYTVVLVPGSGLWNVSYEGLRCGEKQYRRYAYGVDGNWRPLNTSPWRDVRGSGANRYRLILYKHYFCNPMRPYQSAEQMLDSFNESWHEM